MVLIEMRITHYVTIIIIIGTNCCVTHQQNVKFYKEQLKWRFLQTVFSQQIHVIKRNKKIPLDITLTPHETRPKISLCIL